MSYRALYRIWRPNNFEEMVGQEHVTKVLKNQIEHDHVGHAYLFCGTRGTGKTSSAKIFAKGVNCTSEEDNKPCCQCDNCKSIEADQFMDILELDAASNNGVDNIREIKESVKYAPTKGKYKVYIIDEVHMLSSGAFNALLKTLEEPPEYVIFILATTEPHKLPATILSRCQRFDFRRVTETQMVSRMQHICDSIGVSVEEEALMIVARNADGSVRDALSVLDQCLSLGLEHVTRDDVINILGTVDMDFLFKLTDAVIDEDAEVAIEIIENLTVEGKDIHQFLKDWIYHYRNLMITKISNNLETIISMSNENINRLRQQGSRMELNEIKYAIMEISKVSQAAKWSTQPRIMLELIAIRLCLPEADGNVDGLTKRLKRIESALASGTITMTQKKEESIANPQALKKEEIEDKQETQTDQPETEMPVQATKPKGNYKKKWNEIIDQARQQKPSFNMLIQGVKIREVNNQTYYLETESESKNQIIEANRSYLEEIITLIDGEKSKIELKRKDKNQENPIEKSYENDSIMEEINKNFNLGDINIIEE